MADVTIKQVSGGQDTNPAASHAVELQKSDGTPVWSSLTNLVKNLGSAILSAINYEITDSPQLAGLNLGHASDTTMARRAAGRMTIEGNDVLLRSDYGWIPVDVTWTYASATTITVPSGAASIYQKGDKVTMTNDGTKDNYIVDIADTLLTFLGDGVANAAISDIKYSKASSPLDFPHWFGASVTVVGFSADPTGMVNRFRIDGRTVFLNHYEAGDGTSDSTAFTVALPITAASSGVQAIGQVYSTRDSGTAIQTARVVVASGSSTANLFVNASGGGWTASDAKRARFNISYEF